MEHIFCKQNDVNSSINTLSSCNIDLKYGKSAENSAYSSSLESSSKISSTHFKTSISTSDLITEKTINMELETIYETPLFPIVEPNEITGTSPSQSNDFKPRTMVEKIVASSLPARVGYFGEPLKESNKPRNKRPFDNITNSSRFSFLTEELRRADENEFTIEHFMPAELKSTKSYINELDWQDKYAVKRKKRCSTTTSESSTNSKNYCENDNRNFSISTKYFHKRSENSDIIENDISSSNRSRRYGLIHESSSSYSKIQCGENKAYTTLDKTSSSFSAKGKDKFSEFDNFSMSTIDIALANINMMEETPFNVLQKEKIEQFNMRTPYRRNTDDKKLDSLRNMYTFEDNCESNINFTESNKQIDPPQSNNTKNETVIKEQNVPLSRSQINLTTDFVESNELSLSNMIEKKSIEHTERENTNETLKRKRITKSWETPNTAAVIFQPANKILLTATTTNSTSSSTLNSPKHFRSVIQNNAVDLISTTSHCLEIDFTKAAEVNVKLPNYGLISKQTSLRSRSQSSNSNSTKCSHHSGKLLPIKVCTRKLCWGSIKLTKTETKSIEIKNISSKRLILRVAVSGHGFQVINMHDDSNSLILDAQECRALVIKFCPTTVGLATGTLGFFPPQHVNFTETKNIVNLSGYGGHSNIVVSGTLLGPFGSQFITLGEWRDLSQPLVKYFSVHNRGSLDGFVVVVLTSDNFDMQKIIECIEVIPKKAVIPAEDQMTFRVRFKPNEHELKTMFRKLYPATTIANMKLICGDEPTRHRIRKIINDTPSKNLNLVNTEQLALCWNSINGEKTIDELKYLNETADIVMELASSITVYNISLTLNHSILQYN